MTLLCVNQRSEFSHAALRKTTEYRPEVICFDMAWFRINRVDTKPVQILTGVND